MSRILFKALLEASGGSRGGPLLFLDQTEAQRAKKESVWDHPQEFPIPYVGGEWIFSGTTH